MRSLEVSEPRNFLSNVNANTETDDLIWNSANRAELIACCSRQQERVVDGSFHSATVRSFTMPMHGCERTPQALPIESTPCEPRLFRKFDRDRLLCVTIDESVRNGARHEHA